MITQPNYNNDYCYTGIMETLTKFVEHILPITITIGDFFFEELKSAFIRKHQDVTQAFELGVAKSHPEKETIAENL